MSLPRNQLKQPFRVGLNQGIILTRDQLKNHPLYTNGLSGCVALVVANARYVFMAHVSPSSAVDDMAEEAVVTTDTTDEEKMVANVKKVTIERAKKYLDAVISWMEKEEHNGGEIKIHLVANGLEAPTIKSFLKACEDSGYHFTTESAGFCCAVNVNGRLVFEDADPNYRFYDLLGTWKGVPVGFITDRIDADSYGFGEKALDGDYDEVLISNIDTKWLETPLLRESAAAMVKLIFEMTGKVSYPYTYTGGLLKRVDFQFTKANHRVAIDQERLMIYKALLLKFRSVQQGDIDKIDTQNIIKEAVPISTEISLPILETAVTTTTTTTTVPVQLQQQQIPPTKTPSPPSSPPKLKRFRPTWTTPTSSVTTSTVPTTTSSASDEQTIPKDHPHP